MAIETPTQTGFSWRADRRSLALLADLAQHMGGCAQAAVLRAALARLPARLTRPQIDVVLALRPDDAPGRPAHMTLDTASARRLNRLAVTYRLPKAALVRYALREYARAEGRPLAAAS